MQEELQGEVSLTGVLRGTEVCGARRSRKTEAMFEKI